MSKNWQLPRRAFLRGLGTVVALPMLDAMMPSIAKRAMAEAATAASGGVASSGAVGVAAAAVAAPRRMAFIYVPNGVNMDHWRPQTPGTDYAFTSTLKPLKEFKGDINIISGLANRNGFGLGDGGGDHARASASYLTCAHPRKTAGADIHAGISIDQVAANAIGDKTRFPSLELSCDKGQEAGSCDSGYSCAYQFNISWRSEKQPMNPEIEPKSIFDRLFGAGDANESAEARARRLAYDTSVLDLVQDQTRTLQSKLGVTDRRKLDEYFTAIREVEKHIAKNGTAPPPVPNGEAPNFNAEYSFESHMRLMFDIMTLAFQTDSTRIATFVVGHDGSNRPYPFAGVPQGHHHLSHHRGQPAALANLAAIDRFHATQVAYFLGRMKSIKEGDSTLLDNSMIVFGGGISDGNQHNHDNLPLVLAGRGGGTIKTGRHIVLDGDQTSPADYTLQGAATPTTTEMPLANLYLSMLHRMGVPDKSFGDSTGELAALT
jgi:uncharacterized protein DUF1552